MKIKTTELTAIIGMRGSGKTTLAKRLIEIAQDQGVKGIFVYDPLAEYGDLEVERHIPAEPWSQEEFDGICKAIAKRGSTWFIVEEADRYFPQRGYMPKWGSILVNQGRHYGVGLITVSRRIANVNKDLFSLCEHICIYRLFLPNDINYIAEFMPKPVAKSIPNLPKFHFLYYSSEVPEGEVYTVEQDKIVSGGSRGSKSSQTLASPSPK